MDEKIKRLEALVDQNSGRKELHFLLAENYLKANLNEQAKRSFFNAIEIDPYYLKAYVRLGEMHILDDNLDKAELIFKEVIEKNLDLSEPLYMVAMTYKNNGFIEKALFYFKKLLQVDRAYFKAYMEIADIYFDQQQYDEATINYHKAINIDSKRITLYVKLAYAYYMDSDSKKALHILNEGLLIDGSHIEIHVLMAKIYSDLEMKKELDEKVEVIRQLAPHMADEFCQKLA